MRTAFERERALREATGSAAETLHLAEIGAAPLAALARAVDAATVLLYRYDDRGVVAGHGGTLVDALPAYYNELFAEDPVQRALFTLERTPSVVVATRLAGFDERRYRRSAAYHEFYAPHDMEHLLGSGLTPIRYGAPGMTGILFSRSRRQPPFDDTDFAILREATPAFQAAVRRSDRLSRELSRSSDQRSPTLNNGELSQFDANERLTFIARRHGLTNSECEVLSLLAEGLSNREIAERRFVSIETVRTHVQRVLGKLGVDSRTRAALLLRTPPL